MCMTKFYSIDNVKDENDKIIMYTMRIEAPTYVI